jgi:hypothetical protein
MKDPEANLKIPDRVISISDVNQLIDELEAIEEFFLKMKAKSSLNKVDIPKTSPSLDELIKVNTLSLMRVEDREKLKLFLHFLRTKSPNFHVSFGSVPEDMFMFKLTNWFRTQINPYLLITVGLQPNIGAGFRIRTTNKYYDFSLQKYLNVNKQALAESLGTVS